MKGKHFATKTKKRNKMGLGSKKILFISISIFIISFMIVIYWLKSTKDLADMEDNLYSAIATVTDDKEKLNIDFEKLKSINSEVVAWINIKDTDINYPILQTTNNEYYLKRNLYKEYSSCGSIFLDCNTKSDFSEQNTVIYGHNLKNQKMFADLAKIYKGELGKDVYIEIYTEENFYKYKVFSSYMEEPNLEIIQKDFNEKTKKNYVDTITNKSKVQFSCKIEYDRKILTLVTCDSTGKKRVAVHAM